VTREELKNKLESFGLSDIQISDINLGYPIPAKLKIDGNYNGKNFSTFEFDSFFDNVLDLQFKNIDCGGKRLVFEMVYRKYDVRTKEYSNVVDEWSLCNW
jgi:hypothetical protein